VDEYLAIIGIIFVNAIIFLTIIIHENIGNKVNVELEDNAKILLKKLETKKDRRL